VRIVSSTVEEVGGGLVRVTTVLEPGTETQAPDRFGELGSGPNRDAIPDRVVRFLMYCGAEGAQLSEIQRAIGGNPATANRQVWSLGNDSADTAKRLRGWVEARGEGRYALTEAAWGHLRSSQWDPSLRLEMERALDQTLADLPRVVEKARGWSDAADGGNALSARAASDEALFKLLDDSRRANTMYGEITGWEITDATNSFIHAMQLAGSAFRQAVHSQTPRDRLIALDDLGVATEAALEALPGAFGG
jgi:hypothetical protein